jgi:hypothetical protein
MNRDDDWSTLAAAWQAQPVDLDHLRRATRRRTWRMRLLMVLDLVCAAILVAGGAYLFAADAGLWPRVGAAIGVATLGISVLINYRLRSGLWHTAHDSVIGLLKLQRERRRNAIRMALWGPLFLPFGMLTGLLIGPNIALPLAPGQPRWLKILLVSGLLIAFCIGTVLYVRRQRRHIAAIDALLEQMEPPA